MGKITQFEIVFDKNVYFPGQWLQGIVCLDHNQDLEMRSIYLELAGAARVHWSERGQQRHKLKYYDAKQYYFDNEITLLGDEESNVIIHPAGKYTFEFEFQLPRTLPYSFEGPYGNVRYFVECIIVLPGKSNHKIKHFITVISDLDLNIFGDPLSIPQGQDSETWCCLCCASGPVEAVVRLNRKGFVPGESIIIDAEVSNNSSRTIKSCKLQLVQNIRYHATEESRKESVVVSEKRHTPVIEPGQTKSWTAESLLIPPLPHTGLRGCSIMELYYTFQLEVDPASVTLEVIIGTIPPRTNFDDRNAPVGEAGNSTTNAQSGGLDTGVPPIGLFPMAQRTPPMMLHNALSKTYPTEQASEVSQMDIKEEGDSETLWKRETSV